MLTNEKNTEWIKQVFDDFDTKRAKNLEKYEMRDVPPVSYAGGIDDEEYELLRIADLESREIEENYM